MPSCDKKLRALLFDLDGTLTNPGTGITNSIIYALEKYGIKAERSSLYRFIGPPLRHTFMNHFGFSRERAEEAVSFYREYFEKRGMFENELYDGIPELLRMLHGRGVKLVVATSKPEFYAKQIIRHFGLDTYFSSVTGSGMDGSMTSKSELIAHILDSGGLSRDCTAMIGDRQYDIDGARVNGICAIGVRWGYAEEGELEGSGADFIVQNMEQLTNILLELV